MESVFHNFYSAFDYQKFSDLRMRLQVIPLKPNEKVATRVMRLFKITKYLNSIPEKNKFDDKFPRLNPVIISFHEFFHLQYSKVSRMIIENRQFFLQ